MADGCQLSFQVLQREGAAPSQNEPTGLAVGPIVMAMVCSEGCRSQKIGTRFGLQIGNRLGQGEPESLRGRVYQKQRA